MHERFKKILGLGIPTILGCGYNLYILVLSVESCLREPNPFHCFAFLQTPLVTDMDERELAENMQKMLLTMRRLDEKIAPMLEADGKFFNKR
jgi:hypothetical protein